MYQPQVHLHSLYNKKSNKFDVGLLWINMAKMFIFHTYIESYFIKYSKSGAINKHRTKRKFPPKYIRINSKQMNRC